MMIRDVGVFLKYSINMISMNVLIMISMDIICVIWLICFIRVMWIQILVRNLSTLSCFQNCQAN